MLIKENNILINYSVDDSIKESFDGHYFLPTLRVMPIVIHDFLRKEFASLNSLVEKNVEFSLSLRICDNQQIKEINHKYRQKNTATDVLSFPIYDDLRHGNDELLGLPMVELGDIILSLEKAIEQSQEYQLSLRDELIHLIVHGLCHLLGFDHEISHEEEALMQQKEDYLIEQISKMIS